MCRSTFDTDLNKVLEQAYRHLCNHISAGGARPRDYQDERFSYVVLRRGLRPQAPAGARLVSPAPLQRGTSPGVEGDEEWLELEDLEEEAETEVRPCEEFTLANCPDAPLRAAAWCRLPRQSG